MHQDNISLVVCNVPNSIEAPFTPPLYKWLIEAGYTHVLQQGVATDLKAPERSEDDPFIIFPLKPGDEQFNVPENIDRIEPITSSDIADMSNGDPFIRFVMVLPLSVFELYLKSTSDGFWNDSLR